MTAQEANGHKESVRLLTEKTAREIVMGLVKRELNRDNVREPQLPCFVTESGYVRENPKSWTVHFRLPKSEKHLDVRLHEECIEMAYWFYMNIIDGEEDDE